MREKSKTKKIITRVWMACLPELQVPLVLVYWTGNFVNHSIGFCCPMLLWMQQQVVLSLTSYFQQAYYYSLQKYQQLKMNFSCFFFLWYKKKKIDNKLQAGFGDSVTAAGAGVWAAGGLTALVVTGVEAVDVVVLALWFPCGLFIVPAKLQLCTLLNHFKYYIGMKNLVFFVYLINYPIRPFAQHRRTIVSIAAETCCWANFANHPRNWHRHAESPGSVGCSSTRLPFCSAPRPCLSWNPKNNMNN